MSKLNICNTGTTGRNQCSALKWFPCIKKEGIKSNHIETIYNKHSTPISERTLNIHTLLNPNHIKSKTRREILVSIITFLSITFVKI